MDYSRQIRLSEVGEEGQERLGEGKCLVIGAGGLGSPALLYLAAAGVGTIGICDGDRLEASNLHRQPIYQAKDLGKFKAKLASERIQALNPLIQVNAYPFRLTEDNAQELFRSYDLVLDCTDNFRTKFLINDTAFFTQKGVIRASIYQFEGQLQTYLPERGDGCLRCLWEEPPQEGCVGSCQEVGVLGPIPGFFGITQAMEAIKYFLKMPTLGSSEILFTDLIHYDQNKVAFEKKKQCPLCGETPTIQKLTTKKLWEIEAKDLRQGHFELIDIRELEEIEQNPYQNGSYLKMPMSVFEESHIDPEKKYALFCQSGKRSNYLASTLREKGINNVFSLIGGIQSLAEV